MKNLSKNLVSLVLIFTLAMGIFMPSIARAGEYILGNTIFDYSLKEIAVANEEVSAITDMTEYINNKKNEFKATIGLTAAEHLDYNSFFSTEEGNYRYIKTSAINSDENSEGAYTTNLTPRMIDGTLYTGYSITFNYTTVTVTKSSTTSTYIVTFNSNGGSSVNTQSITGNGYKVNRPTDPIKDGNNFVGWYSDEGLTNEWDFDTVVTSNMTLYAKWESTASTTPTKINTVNIGIASPKVGDTATATTKPSVTIDSNPNYEIDHIAYVTAYPSEKPAGEYDAPFTGTFEEGKDYVVEVSLKAKDGFAFVDNNGMTLKVNGKTTGFEKNEWNADGSTYYMFFAKVQATKEETPTTPTEETTNKTNTPTYEYIEGQNQTFNITNGTGLSFRINADYSLFENGGKVYIDDKEVSKENYTSKSGSTIITFTDEYAKTLAVGEHTLKVTFNNGGSATTKFTIANATVETASSATTTATPVATTVGSASSNPRTGDNLVFYISLMIVSSVGIAGTVFLIKKKYI